MKFRETLKTPTKGSGQRALLAHIAYAFFLSIALSAFGVSSETNNQTQWKQAPSLPYKVQEIYPAMYKDHIVIAGGLSPDVDENRIGVSDRVLLFSLKDQKWMDGPRLPAPRHHPMLVVVNNRLLSFGGFTVDGQGAWHNSLDVLELVADSESPGQDVLTHGKWQKIAQLPAPLAETLHAVKDGIVHLVSGRTPAVTDKNNQWNHQTDVSTHYLFDPETLSWSAGADLPTARNSACSIQTKDSWHTIGGRTVAGGNHPSHEAYQFSSKKWLTLAPLPKAQGGLACAAANGRIYVFGGEYFNNGGGVYSDVWEYDLGSNSWRSASQMPNPRHGLGALNIEGNIYVIGGASQAGGNQTSDAMSIFLPQ